MNTIIYSTLTNNMFLETQYKSIKKFFQTDFEFIVFDDSRETKHNISYNKIQTQNIKNTCKKLDIKYIRIPPNAHYNRNEILPEEYVIKDGVAAKDHPVTRCALAVQYGFNYIIRNYTNSYLFLIDSDMFFINYFNINKHMEKYNIYGISQNRGIEYLWNGIFICDLNKCDNLKEFNWEAGEVLELDKNNNKTNISYSCDVGGHNYHYLKKYGYFDENENKLLKAGAIFVDTINSVWLKSDENNKEYFDKKMVEFISKFCYLKTNPPEAPKGWINKEFFLDNNVFHIRGGGGWCYHKEEYHRDCVELINNFIDSM